MSDRFSCRSTPQLLYIAIPAVLLGIQAVGVGQTTQPAGLSHAGRLKEAAKEPILKPEYRSASGKPLTETEAAEIVASTALLKEAADLRMASDYGPAEQKAQQALAIRSRILGGHYLTSTASAAAETLARFSAASPETGKKLAEADRQFAAAKSAYLRGEYSAAKAAAAAAVRIRERILGKDQVEVGLALRLLGSSQTELEELARGERSLDRALRIAEQGFGKVHPEVALVLDRSGWLQITLAARRGFDRNTLEKAVVSLRRSVRIFRSTVGETAEEAEALDNLGTVMAYVRDHPRALECKLRSLVIREAVLGPEARDTAVSLSNLGWLYGQMGMDIEVLPLKRRALAILVGTVGPGHPYAMTERLNLAQVYRQRGMPDEAIQLLEQHALHDDRGPDAITANLVRHTIGLCVAYLEAGRLDDAVRMMDKAFDQAVAAYNAGEEQAAIVELAHLAVACRQRRMLDDAGKAYRQVRSWDMKNAGRPNQVMLRRLVELGGLYIQLGRLSKAKELLTEAVRQSKALHGEGALDTFTSILTLSLALEKMGELDDAARFCEKALQICESKLPRGSRRQAYATAALGRILTLQKKFDMAKFSLEEAKELMEAYEEREPLTGVSVLHDLATFYGASGKQAEALGLLRQSLEQCRDMSELVDSPHVTATTAKSVKLLLDALQGQGPSTKKECEALHSELKTLLDSLTAARALDAENRRWLEELGVSGSKG